MQSRKQLARLAEALGGIAVWGCLPGSPAQRLGVRYGDVILSVNGQRTSTAEEFVNARALRADMAEVLVFRDGLEVALELEFESSPSPLTDDQMHAVAVQVAEARLAPSDHPPPSEPSYGSSMT